MGWLGESSPVGKVSALAIHLRQMTFQVSVTKCLAAQKVDKLHTSLSGGVHSTETDASLSGICVTHHLPGQREDGSRGVAMGGYLRTERRSVFLLLPALVSDLVGW